MKPVSEEHLKILECLARLKITSEKKIHFLPFHNFVSATMDNFLHFQFSFHDLLTPTKIKYSIFMLHVEPISPFIEKAASLLMWKILLAPTHKRGT
jgi:hypothetical protein